MSKNNWLLLVALLGLSVVYVHYFTDWFRPKVIQIYHVSRSSPFRHQRQGDQVETVPVTFGLNARSQLTELQVVPLDAWQTNHNALPIWHLIGDPKSEKIKSFYYGQDIPGMKPAVAGTHAAALEPNVTYHLSLRAGHPG